MIFSMNFMTYKKYLGFLVIILAGILISFKSANRVDRMSINTGFSVDVNSEFSLSNVALLTENDSIIIPLKRSGKLFIMDAIIDDQSGNLVFDSGATGIVLNRTYFRNYVVMENQASKGITGSVDKNERITANYVKISELSYQHVTAQLAELGHIENRRGVKILGLFGFGLIKNYEIIFDPLNLELRLYRIDIKGNRTSRNTKEFKPDYIQKINIVNNVVFLKGTIGGKNLRFCFDTGAEANVISSDEPKAVLSTITINSTSKLQGAGTSTSDVLYGTMNDFIFGTTQLASMATIVTNLDHLKEAYGVSFDGIVGYDFISNGSFCINFVKNQFCISFIKTGKK
jgi:predicted aspartyl protease